ncbi:Asp-tRNA(Asn)/Glu-tRNA(Gln) amidotransferase subunit GatC [Govanella unica]|uniref:Aspartyl/glutamyl-tRNA(Asn/Gln) amidotransferase subunit C n=1 Tax=Govanella unica TaxID=2975056 RepID=A0A9X3Z6I8_9PROT|nr:Asp-tRNA(Asn)/Glu-tRNA(Gln) amidotransferase subunit GatC [Govania unica]MDA5193127.1 Asp-tRNA(Asn)/Glu-tRNA(Gln) amidotransferase subunit GatC [Govania unica]
MSIDLSTVRRIANLARIEVADADLPPLAAELNTILAFVEELSAVNTDGVEPMTSVVHVQLPLRADEVTDGGYPDVVLANAPNAEHGFFTVPKVIE